MPSLPDAFFAASSRTRLDSGRPGNQARWLLSAFSLYHLVSAGEHLRGNVDAERLGGVEIDHQLVLGWRLHRKVRWLLALKDAIDVAGRAVVLCDLIGS